MLGIIGKLHASQKVSALLRIQLMKSFKELGTGLFRKLMKLYPFLV
jgi:hypothetical protein